jgi:hypothetical protein
MPSLQTIDHVLEALKSERNTYAAGVVMDRARVIIADQGSGHISVAGDHHRQQRGRRIPNYEWRKLLDAIHVRDLYDPDGWADYLWRKLGQGASALRSVSPATDDAPTDLTPSRFDRPEKCGSRPAHAIKRVRRGPHPSPKVWREVPSADGVRTEVAWLSRKAAP